MEILSHSYLFELCSVAVWVPPLAAFPYQIAVLIIKATAIEPILDVGFLRIIKTLPRIHEELLLELSGHRESYH